MPNHVTHCITIPGKIDSRIEKLGDENRKICFDKIIPMPPQVYRGDGISTEDDKDFGDLTSIAWRRKNWGTKWNAYDTSIEQVGDNIELRFDTAWSIPYPIIIAIANVLPDTDFTHEYFDEGHNFWGREKWSKRNRRTVENGEELKRELCMKLKNYDPDQTEDDEEVEG